MKRKYGLVLMAPEDDEFGGGGGGYSGSDIWDESTEDDSDDGLEDDGGYEPEEQTSKEHMVPLSAIQDVVRGMQPQPQEPQLTQEQIDAQLKVFRPDAAFARQFFNGEPTQEQEVALATLVQKMTEHFTTVMGHANRLTREDIARQYQPALEAVREQKTQMFTEIAVKRFPVLKGKERVVRHVIDQLNQQGYRPANEQEAFQVVSQHVERIVQMSDPGFSLNKKQPQTVAPQMARLNGGSGGGSASVENKGKGGAKKPGWAAIFD